MYAVIEIPKNSKYKYEIKKGKLVVDRALKLHCPQNYGYILGTRAEDGDNLDVFVMTSEPLQAKSMMKIVPIGVMICKDGGVLDEKILAILEDENYLYEMDFGAIKWYLDRYKKGFEVIDLKDKNEALALIEKYRVK